ncbi:MAG: aromatic acid exporter family protein [bacterium]
MVKILYGLKIAIAAILAIAVANIFSLDFSVSAGIVAILSIAQTKKETFKTLVERILAFILAIAIAFVCFNLIGFTYISYFVYLLFYLILCKYKNWNSAMAINSVLVSHFLTLEQMDASNILNEFLLLGIGAFFGVLVNLHLRANDNYMKQMFIDINIQVKKILRRISERISNENLEDYNGTCFTSIKESIRIANDKAKLNFMNRFSNKSTDFEYINLKEQEVHILYNIYKKLTNLNVNLITTESVSNFIFKLSETYDNDLEIDNTINEFHCLREEIRKTDLPKDRSEFEDRAKLYIVLEYLEELLLLKKEFINKTIDL